MWREHINARRMQSVSIHKAHTNAPVRVDSRVMEWRVMMSMSVSLDNTAVINQALDVSILREASNASANLDMQERQEPAVSVSY